MTALTLEARLARLEDDAAIRDLVARFSDCAIFDDAANAENLGSLFTSSPHAAPSWEVGPPFNKRITEMEQLNSVRDNLSYFAQHAHSGVLDISPDGKTAKARWIVSETSEYPGKKFFTHQGFYNDTYVKEEGKWKFLTRKYNFLYLDTRPLTGEYVDYTLPDGRPIWHAPGEGEKDS